MPARQSRVSSSSCVSAQKASVFRSRSQIFDREKGSVTIIFQEVGATTMALGALNEGDCLHDFVGPLGKASELEGLKKVAVVGGGLGCAIAYPQAKKLHEMGAGG